LKLVDPVVLGLHGLGALVALSVALASASAIRRIRTPSEGDMPTLEAA
jgi:hypothetical protein